MKVIVTGKGMFTAISAGQVKIANSDGSKSKVDCLKATFETANFDYEQCKELDKNICATLLNIQPMPFTKIEFPFKTFETQIELTFDDCESKPIALSFIADIQKIIVKVCDNVPIYQFKLIFIDSKNMNNHYLKLNQELEMDLSFNE